MSFHEKKGGGWEVFWLVWTEKNTQWRTGKWIRSQFGRMTREGKFFVHGSSMGRKNLHLVTCSIDGVKLSLVLSSDLQLLSKEEYVAYERTFHCLYIWTVAWQREYRKARVQRKRVQRKKECKWRDGERDKEGERDGESCKPREEWSRRKFCRTRPVVVVCSTI